MLARSRQSTVKPETEAEPLIEAAQRELKKVLRKQGFQMKADAFRQEEQRDKATVEQGKADGVALASGDYALSAMLGKLFNLFKIVPVSFGGTSTLDPQAQTQAFAQKARELLLALTITGTTREHKGFDDVELIVAGSSAMGYSPHKVGKPAFGDKSDIDLGVVSPKLLAACADWGATMRGLQDRTAPDPLPAIDAVSRQLEKLVPFVKADGSTTDRKVSIMVYKSRDVAQRGVGVQI